MGRWKNFYESFLDVDEPPYVGSVHVGYETLVPLSGKERPREFPAWERLVIWKARNSENALCAQIPHVNTDLCLRKLVRSRLQQGTTVHLYLTDYTPGREVFEVRSAEQLPEDFPIAGLPPVLEESDEDHAKHPG